MEAQARREEESRAAVQQQPETSSAQLALEQALSEAREEALAARVEEEAARSEEEEARARMLAARARKVVARERADAATAREAELLRQIAATPTGPAGSGRGATLPQKVSRVCAHLGLEADGSLSAAVAMANARAGIAAEGGLLQQVDRLLARCFGRRHIPRYLYRSFSCQCSNVSQGQLLPKKQRRGRARAAAARRLGARSIKIVPSRVDNQCAKEPRPRALGLRHSFYRVCYPSEQLPPVSNPPTTNVFLPEQRLLNPRYPTRPKDFHRKVADLKRSRLPAPRRRPTPCSAAGSRRARRPARRPPPPRRTRSTASAAMAAHPRAPGQ